MIKSPKRRLSYLVLCVSLVAVVIIFGIPVSYNPTIYYLLAFVQFGIIFLSAWFLGVRAIRAVEQHRRIIAAAGGLLIMPWMLFSFFAGIGPPPEATPSENQLRYIILLISSFAVAGGMIVLRKALSDAGESFYSTLGTAFIVLAGPMYAIFSAISLGEYRALERMGTLKGIEGVRVLDELSIIVLFMGVILTYLATASFSLAFRHPQWLGKTSSRAFAGICLIASVFVGIKVGIALGSATDPMWNFSPWYALPGQIFSIPAVPWMIPCLLGIVLLKRAGDTHP